jgi:hypothetical protein
VGKLLDRTVEHVFEYGYAVVILIAGAAVWPVGGSVALLTGRAAIET